MNVRIAKKILSRPEAYPPHQVERARRITARREAETASSPAAAPAAAAAAPAAPAEEPAPVEEPAPADEPSEDETSA